GVIEVDIDHDGDLDLIAATTDGDVLIWLNDGHGRFTRKAPFSKRDFSSEPVVTQISWPESMAISISTPVLSGPIRGEATDVVRPIRSPGDSIPHDVRRSILPPLRAPPVDLA